MKQSLKMDLAALKSKRSQYTCPAPNEC